MSETIVPNGVDGSTGGYAVPGLSIEEISEVAQGKGIDPSNIKELQDRSKKKGRHFGPEEGVDPKELSQAGWGVIFAQSDGEQRIKELKSPLKDLLDRRRDQAGGRHEEGGLYEEYAYEPEKRRASFWRGTAWDRARQSPAKCPTIC